MQQIKISDIYYTSINNPTLLDIIQFKLSKCNNKLCKFINNIIDYTRYDNKHTNKLVSSYPLSLQVKNDSGYNTAIEVHKTGEYTIWVLETCNGLKLRAADHHRVYTRSYDGIESWKYMDEVTVYDSVMTDTGWDHVYHIMETNESEFMYDFSIKENSHSYLTNGILSHNTTSTASFLAWRLIFSNDLTALIVANKKDTAIEILGKLKEFLEGLPFFLKPGIISMSSKHIKLENGSSIKCAATSKTPATGDSIKLLYIDETAVIPPNIIDEFWASVQPTMSSFRGSQIIMTSTPRGKGNLFYRTYEGALNGTNGFVSTRVDWWEVPGRDKAWEEQQRLELGDEMFNREFGLSFESSTSRLLSAWYIKFTDRIKKTFISRELYGVPKEISDNIYWHPDFDPGELTYYGALERYFLFVVDTAEGIEKGAAGKKDSDYNIINIFELKTLSPSRIEKNRIYSPSIDIRDVMSYRQVGIYMDNNKDEEASAEAAKMLAFNVFKTGYRDIDNVRVLIEMNFNGKNWVNKFMAHPGYYDPIIIKCPRGQSADEHNIKYDYGFKTVTGKRGKNYYCELGSKMMDKLQIILQQYNEEQPNKSTLYQLQNFGKNNKGQYEGSCVHDDIAVTCLFVSIAQEQPMFRQWCEEWLEHQPPTDNIQRIRRMLEIYVETEPTVSDEEFSKFFNMATAHMNTGMGGQSYTSMINNSRSNQAFNNMRPNPNMGMQSRRLPGLGYRR